MNNKQNQSTDQPIFGILMLACFGDILICNSLVQNIKRIYPDSKVVFIVDRPWKDIAKYQKGVDDVCIYDKRGEHKGIFGLIKFIREFPYKNFDYLLRFHPTERAKVVSHLLRSKRMLKGTISDEFKMQQNMANILKDITDEEIISYPITYDYSGELPEKFKNIFKEGEKYIALCTTTKQLEKDMPIDTSIELINKLNKENYNVIYVGAGQLAQEHAQQFTERNCKFINLVDKTSLTDLACVLKSCNALISVDTGTMHFGYALSVPTVGIFYKKDLISLWAPSEDLYNVKVITDDYTSQNIYEKLETLLNK